MMNVQELSIVCTEYSPVIQVYASKVHLLYAPPPKIKALQLLPNLNTPSSRPHPLTSHIFLVISSSLLSISSPAICKSLSTSTLSSGNALITSIAFAAAESTYLSPKRTKRIFLRGRHDGSIV